MTNHVSHTNKMIFDLKTQHQTKVSELQDKVADYENTIKDLNQLIELLTQDRYYDC